MAVATRGNTPAALFIVVRRQMVPGEARQSFWSWTMFGITPGTRHERELARGPWACADAGAASREARRFRAALGLTADACPVRRTG